MKTPETADTKLQAFQKHLVKDFDTALGAGGENWFRSMSLPPYSSCENRHSKQIDGSLASVKLSRCSHSLACSPCPFCAAIQYYPRLNCSPFACLC